MRAGKEKNCDDGKLKRQPTRQQRREAGTSYQDAGEDSDTELLNSGEWRGLLRHPANSMLAVRSTFASSFSLLRSGWDDQLDFAAVIGVRDDLYIDATNVDVPLLKFCGNFRQKYDPGGPALA